jgi:uncharacterized protein YxjI
MTKIRIDGEAKDFVLDKVQESVINLSGTYFWRHSDKITRVEGRFYRKESKLIIKDYKGNFIIRNTAIKLAPNVYAAPNDANVVQTIDGDWVSKDMAVSVDNNYYLITDDRVVKYYDGITG